MEHYSVIIWCVIYNNNKTLIHTQNDQVLVPEHHCWIFIVCEGQLNGAFNKVRIMALATLSTVKGIQGHSFFSDSRNKARHWKWIWIFRFLSVNAYGTSRCDEYKASFDCLNSCKRHWNKPVHQHIPDCIDNLFRLTLMYVLMFMHSIHHPYAVNQETATHIVCL